MKSCSIGLLIIFSPLGLCAPSTLHLYVGEQRFVPVPDLVRFTSPPPGVIKIAPTPHDLKGILIRSLKPGVANLLLWLQETSSPASLEVHVHPVPKSDLQAFVRSFPPTDGLQVVVLPEKIGLFGRLSNLADWLLVRKWVQTDPQKVHFGLELEGPALAHTKNELQVRLKRGCPHTEVTITPKHQTLLLNPKGGRCTVALHSLSDLHPEVAWEATPGVSLETPLLIRIYLLENRSKSHSPLSYNLLQEPLSLQRLKDALEGRDENIRILSQPELMIQAQGSSELFLGGEVPIPKRIQRAITYDHRPFGLKIMVETKGFERELLRIRISTEITDIEPELSVDSTPGFQAHRVTTEVLASLSQAIVLGGLSHTRNQTSRRGLPWIRKIPLIRRFFSDLSEDSETKELSLVLVPEPWVAKASLSHWNLSIPEGLKPPPRNYLTPSQISQIKTSKDYPWNAFSHF